MLPKELLCEGRMEPTAERRKMWSEQTTLRGTEVYGRFEEWVSKLGLPAVPSSLLFDAFLAGYEFGVTLMELPGGTRVLRQD